MKLPWLLPLCTLLSLAPLRAEVTTGTNLSVTVSSLPEAMLTLTQHITVPLLRGESFLTAGNNLRTALFYNVSPVSMNAGTDITLTPIAFAQLKTGASIGTGWNFPGLAPHAWGINEPQPDKRGLIDGAPFEAAIWQVYGAVVFQFDMGILIPGDWTHVQAQTTQRFSYRANTRAASGEPWSHENDGGENRNAPHYYGAYVLGYQFPAVPILNRAAFMAEIERHFYDTPGRADFGDDLPKWTFSGLINLTITPWLDAAFMAQFRLNRNFLNGTEANFFMARQLNRQDPFTLNFYRAIAVLSFKIR
jgi:hypothetical protein